MSRQISKGYIVIFVTLTIVAIGILFVGYFSRQKLDIATNQNSKVAISPELKKPMPTAMPFIEMTIPYLGQRGYQSSLSELNKISENPSYTSYLTSYESDGLTINGLLTIPKNSEEKHPAIVFVHGYIPPTLYKTTQNYASYVDNFAKNGFVVFKIDLRGHGNSEGEAGGAYYSSDYVIDTLNAYAALQSATFVNSNSVGLWGHSMAGNVTMRAFAAKPDIPAVVVWAGAGYTYTDLQEYRISDYSYRPPELNTQRAKRREELRKAHGDFDPKSEFWKQVAITNYLNGLKGALEIHHAVDDNVVSIEYSRNLIRLLNDTNVRHQLFEYSSGGHNISGASFSTAMSISVEFFKSHLQ